MRRCLVVVRYLLPLALFGMLAVAGCGKQEAAAAKGPLVLGVSAIENREGRVWVKGTNVPFTGQLREWYTNGVVKADASFKDGRMEGATRGYYPSGQLQSEESFVAGVSDGIRRRFHEDGTPKLVEGVVGGRLHGRYERYHTNGVLAERAEYREGEPEGLAESWDAAGHPLARVRFEKGKVVEQTFAKDSAPSAIAGTSSP